MNIVNDLTALAKEKGFNTQNLIVSGESWKYSELPVLEKLEQGSALPIEDDTLIINDGAIHSLPSPSHYEGMTIREESFSQNDCEENSEFFSGIAPMLSSKKIVIRVHGKMVLPLRIKHYSESGISNSYIDLRVEQGASLNILEEAIEDQNSYFGSFFKASLESESCVNHAVISGNPKGTSVMSRSVDVSPKASYNISHISFENKMVRSQGEIRLQERSSSEVLAINLGKNESHFDFDLHVNHLGDNAKSDQRVRNILKDRSVGVFTGRVSIHQGTKDNSAGQSCKSILMSEESKVFSRPQLDIDTDEVICSHGSTTGRIDETLLLYLQSRGLKKELALSMLIQGQLKELICKIRVAEFRQRINNRVSRELGRPEQDGDDHCSFSEFSFV